VFTAQNETLVVHFWEDFPFFCQNHPHIFHKVVQQKAEFYSSHKQVGLDSLSLIDAQNKKERASVIFASFDPRVSSPISSDIANAINEGTSHVSPNVSQIEIQSKTQNQILLETETKPPESSRNQTQSSVLELFDKQHFDKLAFDQVFQKGFSMSALQSALQSTSAYVEQKAIYSSFFKPNYWVNPEDKSQHYFWLIYLARHFFHTLLKRHFPLIWSYQCFLDRKNKVFQNDTTKLKQKLKTYRLLWTKFELNWGQKNLPNSFEDLLLNKSGEMLLFEQSTHNESNSLNYPMLQEQTEHISDNVTQRSVYNILQEKVHQCICDLNKSLLLPKSSFETFVFQLPNYARGSLLPLSYEYPYNSMPGWIQVQVNDNVCFFAQKNFRQISQMSFAYQILCDPLGMGTGLFTSNSKTLSVWLKTLKSKTYSRVAMTDLMDKKPMACSTPVKTIGAYKSNHKTKKIQGLYDCFSLLQWGYMRNNKEALVQSTAAWGLRQAYLDTIVNLKPFYTKIQRTKQVIKTQVFTTQSTWHPVFYTPLNNLETGIEADVLQTFWQCHRQHHIVFLKMFYGCISANVKETGFQLFYVPLSCRYSNLPKGFLRNTKGTLRKHNLNNPLGHKNFRKFIPKHFAFSLQKSRLVAQLKHIAYQCMKEIVSVQMQTSMNWLFNIVKPNSIFKTSKPKELKAKTQFNLQRQTKRKPFVSTKRRFQPGALVYLNHFITIAKQTTLNKIIWSFSNQDGRATIENPELPFETFLFRFSQDVFNLKPGPKPKPNKLTPVNQSIQEKHIFLTGFVQPLWSSIWSESNDPIWFWSKKIATNALFNQWEKQQWKPDAFFLLQQKKRLIHTKISTICHKINVFLSKAKVSLSVVESELNGLDLQNLVPRTLSVRASERLKTRQTEQKHVQFFYEDPKVWLTFFNLPEKATMLEYIKQFQTYFSLKTKLIKSKTVRLWFTNGLVKHHRLEQWPLNKLTWLVMIKLGSTISHFDQIMYSRVRFHRRTATLPLKHGFSHCLETFLEQNNKLKNTFYLVKQTFSWPVEDDYDMFVEFISPHPHKTDAIIPAYVNKCITFDQPRTGAWAIHTLLKQFKPLKPSIKPPIYGYIDDLKSQIQALYKTMTFYTTFFQSLRVTPLKQKLHGEGLDRSFTSHFNVLKKRRTKYQTTRQPMNFTDNIKRFKKTTSNPLEIKKNLKVFYQRQLSRLQLKQNKLTRRLKLLLPFMHPNHCPAWLILTCLPILPPGLRPILSLNPGQFAIADLNKLYQQVIYRNERLRDLTELTVPFGLVNPYLGFRKLFRLYIRLIQQAVDALMDNGRSDSMAVVGNNGQPLKSLSESLRGKKGRFRQNLLGKRVDYSGRSVIVVGPQLQVHQCGLPKQMAIVLFQPFLLRALMHQNYTLTYLQAKKLIRNQHPIIWPLLNKILQNHPVLLNRAPTLHRLGIQAFQPCLVSGQAILLHPLVCSAFNADFDGDQMAVHVPLSYDACSEAWKLMWSRNQFFSPSMGDPVLIPTQDIVLGCYYLSTWDSIKHKRFIAQQTYGKFGDEKLGHGKPSYAQWFTTMDQVLHAFWLYQLDEHQMIWLNWSGNLELEKDSESCFEFQLNHDGSVCFFYDDLYQWFEPINNQFKTWIKTTPGRVLLNQLFLKNR
jgi:DNA-directed RNA polymerase beta' subunit